MKEIDIQKEYWDSVATSKTFTHGIPFDLFSRYVSKDASILDYGCGYGRSCFQLYDNGYKNIIGVDISTEMIKQAQSKASDISFQYFNGSSLPYADNSISACTLLAVLTCIPTNAGQRTVINEISRVLKKDGVLFVSDYLLQNDSRNQERYKKYQSDFDNYGTFKLEDKAILRHHKRDYIEQLLQGFSIISEKEVGVNTMNGNKSTILQMLLSNNKS